MLKGKAIGGPLNDVMIQGSTTWSGIVRGHLDGRYSWSSDENTWVWTAMMHHRKDRFIHGRANKSGPTKSRTYKVSDDDVNQDE